jgi:hypothetical protein
MGGNCRTLETTRLQKTPAWPCAEAVIFVRGIELLTRASVPAGAELRGPALAKTVIVTGADGYRVAFGLAEFDPAFTNRVSILADRKDGGPLAENALPFQIILADEKRPARCVRQVVSIEVRPAP